MAKKRIAVFIDWYLPGTKAGGPVRSVYSLVKLLHNEHDFFIITSDRDLGSSTSYDHIESNKWSEYKGVPVYYFSQKNLTKENLLRVIDELKADILYLNSFWSYWFSILPLQLKKQGKVKARIILAPRGMLSKGALSLKPLKKYAFITWSKISGLHRNILFHATTQGEEQEIKKFFPNAKIVIASNVNTTQPVINKNVEKKSGELKLFFLSRVAKVKNLHYALEVLERVGEGKIIYDVFGAIEDAAYKSQCDAIIKRLPSNITVNFKGEIDFDAIQETIKEYHYLFLPTLNENFGHSIVESLLSACPVIISDQTPWNGVTASGCGYAIDLNKKEEFVKVIQKILKMNDAEYKQSCANCIIFIKDKVDVVENIKAYTRLFS